jgi:hypothetical protein
MPQSNLFRIPKSRSGFTSIPPKTSTFRIIIEPYHRSGHILKVVVLKRNETLTFASTMAKPLITHHISNFPTATEQSRIKTHTGNKNTQN